MSRGHDNKMIILLYFYHELMNKHFILFSCLKSNYALRSADVELEQHRFYSNNVRRAQNVLYLRIITF